MSSNNEKIEITVTKGARRNVMIIVILGIMVAVVLFVLWGVTADNGFGIAGFVLLVALIFIIYFGLLASHLKLGIKEHKYIKEMEEFVRTNRAALADSYTFYIKGEKRYVSRDRGFNASGYRLQSIKEIEGIQYENHLRLISLTHNNFTKIENLENCKALETLELANCSIEKIDGLDKLSTLKNLDLSNNKISVIEGLANLVNLEHLNLVGNPIKWPEGLSEKSTAQEIVMYCRKMKGLPSTNSLQSKSGSKPTIQEIDHQVTELYKLGNVKIDSGKYDEAIQIFNEGLSLGKKYKLKSLEILVSGIERANKAKANANTTKTTSSK